MTWQRAPAAAALVGKLSAAVAAGTLPVTVFDKPPATLNAPALVVGRPLEVRYATAAFGIDEAELPVVVVAGADGDDMLDSLITTVREAVAPDPTLGGVVQSAIVSLERNWRNLTVAGADVLTADVLLTIQM